MQQQNWIIQKFGGTSVGKFPEQICDEIVKVYSQQHRVAVVCSARSSYTKAEGTTSRLLAAADAALDDAAKFGEIIEVVRKDHVDNALARISNVALQQQLVDDTNRELDQVFKLLEASQIIGEVSVRTLDLVMSVGEKLACMFVSCLFNDRGLKSTYVDLSNVFPSDYDVSNGFDDKFYRFLSERFAAELNRACANGEVPVITGFFGLIPGGLLNGVGRGYTDLCAALVAVGVGADELQVWKEVDGIFTADPRKVKTARLLASVTPEEAAELTYYGSEVIHPFTMEQVIKAKIPIRIKNVSNPTGNGTIIYPDNVAKKGEQTPPHPPIALSKIPEEVLQRKKGATAITTKHQIVVVNIHSNRKTLSHGFLAQIFSILDRYKLVVDLISTSEVHVSMALSITDSDGVRNLRLASADFEKIGTVDITRNLAIVSLVGKNMKQHIGIAGTMFHILAENHINIEMISQGANEINISCVIDEANAVAALQAIHTKLLDHPAPMTVLRTRLEQLKMEEA